VCQTFGAFESKLPEKLKVVARTYDSCMSTRGEAAGVVLASGSGTRVGAAVNKVYLPVSGRSVVSWSLNTLASVPGIGPLVLVIRPEDRELAERALTIEVDRPDVEVVTGGATRQESELMALRQLAGRIGDESVDTVLIHDAARPFVGADLVASVLRAAREFGGAIPGVPRDDLVSVISGTDQVGAPLEQVVAVQTPQGFRAAPLLAAYESAAAEGFVGTDTASCMERFSDVPVRCIAGDVRNFKITYPHDLVIAERVLLGAD
jgi:2-C-methyl-D-erythritol 4-phosphate cytidylyltransferase